MYKSLDSYYETKPTSRPVSWVKRKKRMTVDGFITGYKPGEAGFNGLVGALEISVFDENGISTPIAMVSSIELEVRKELTAPDGSLKEEYLFEVVEVSFQEIASRSNRGRHATFDKFRPDKNSKECTIYSMTMS